LDSRERRPAENNFAFASATRQHLEIALEHESKNRVAGAAFSTVTTLSFRRPALD